MTSLVMLQLGEGDNIVQRLLGRLHRQCGEHRAFAAVDVMELIADLCGHFDNIALRHIFRNAMVPLVQYIPSAFLNTVVGSIYIESLYSIPGMGGLLVTCVQRHDNTMVQGIVLLYACVGIIGLILGDLLMVLIDPRISFGKKEGGR